MKRILVYGMTEVPGGIESYIMSIYRALDRTEICFDFLTMDNKVAYQEEIENNGDSVYKIPSKGKHPIRCFLALYRLLKNHPDYGTVYFNMLSASEAFLMMPAVLLKRKIITHSHNGFVKRKWLHELFQPYLNRHADRKLACSIVAGNFLYGKRHMNSNEVTIIHNTIDAKKYAYDPVKRESVRKKLGLENKRVICHVGRLCYQKNPFVLVDIFNKIHESDPDTVLLSVGTGDMDKEVMDYAGKTKASESIYFLGVRKDIPDLMQAADVFILPSLFEGLPFVGIEAQAAGLPCLFADTITTEVDITGNCMFLPLDDQKYTKWIEAYVGTLEFQRENLYQKIVEAGYDKTVLNDKEAPIYECFN